MSYTTDYQDIAIGKPEATIAQGSVVALVNGSAESALGQRTIEISSRLTQYRWQIAYRNQGRLSAVFSFIALLFRRRPQIVYVMDMAAAGVLAALCYRLVFRRSAVVIDFGDAITALAQAMGRSQAHVTLVRCIEHLALKYADHLIVRGRSHVDLLRQQGRHATFVPDGITPDNLQAKDGEGVRQKLGLANDALLVGVVGTLSWNPLRSYCYGMELVDAFQSGVSENVYGIIIGDGDGRSHLEQRIRTLGLENRINLTGRIPLAEVGPYLDAIDVALSTQTSDVVGQVRTTGKLPLYMASGTYTLASDNGEAHHILPEPMRIPYEGRRDFRYGQLLAERLNGLADKRQLLRVEGAELRELAKENYHYDELAIKVNHIFKTCLTPGDAAPAV